MTDYKLLAIRYLKQNKSRSITTIIGTTITVAALFAILNIGWGYLLQHRQNLREEQDYEVVMLTETQEQIEDVLADDRVKSAYVGQYCYYHNGITEDYLNALYINTKNPYKIDSIVDELRATYEIEAIVRNELAWTYLQGSEGSFIVVIIYFSVLVAFIFAIIGVGIIRNSIQLNMFENIRDYGNLRCIGSSKSELNAVIFIQGMLLEVAGIVFGTMLGTIFTFILSKFFEAKGYFRFQGGFHGLPFALILATFMIDLYFAMGENSKLVTKMTPVSAIRGEYRIKKEKIRLHENNILRKFISRVLGIDGDYAFKNIMRSPGRFWKTVGALVFGIAGFMVIAGLYSTFTRFVKLDMQEYGYYQLYWDKEWGIDESLNSAEASLPPKERLQRISNSSEVVEARLSYSATGFAYDWEECFKHYSDDYKEYNDYIDELQEKMLRYMCGLEESSEDYDLVQNSAFTFRGYEEEDLKRCQEKLVEGTTDLSENGVLIVNRFIEYEYYENEFGYDIREIDLPIFDYQLGDQINVIDIEELHKRLDPKLVEVYRWYDDEVEKILQKDPNDTDHRIIILVQEARKKKFAIIKEVYQSLVDDECYKTYVVEGILDADPNLVSDLHLGSSIIIMRQDSICELAGLDASTPTGIRYHLDRIPRTNYLRLENEDNFIENSSMIGSQGFCMESGYLYSVEEYNTVRKYVYGAALIVIFILTMSMINSINATSSNLNLRRREFAQLRVIGVSKKHLIRMVVYEGLITAIVASVIGIMLGLILSCVGYWAFGILSQIPYHFPIGIAALSVLFSCIVLCAAIYIPLSRLDNDLAKDLKMGAE